MREHVREWGEGRERIPSRPHAKRGANPGLDLGNPKIMTCVEGKSQTLNQATQMSLFSAF